MGIGTLFGLLLGLAFYVLGFGADWAANSTILGIILISVGLIFSFAPFFVLAFFWPALQEAEETIPRISELFLQDRPLKLVKSIFLLFPLLTFAFAIDIFFVHFFSARVLVSVWFLLFGLSLDAFAYLMNRISGFLNPFFVADLFTKEATRSIHEDKEIELYKWIDAQVEEGMSAINRRNESLCNHVCNNIQHIARVYLESAKVLPKLDESQKIPELGISDKVSYTLFYLLQHLEKINIASVDKGLESICNNNVTAVGKIVISAAKYDLSMVNYPLFFLGKFSVEAQKKGMLDVGTKSIVVLVEVARAILTEIDVTYLELREPFERLITQLDEVTKEMFRQDKSLNAKFLMQPFLDIKEMFETEKMRLHPDSEAIIQFINKSLEEYRALDTILRTAPPRPMKKASSEEDS